MDAPMNGGSSSNDAVAATATNAATAATALWGAGSLTERFGNLSGRELQEHCFQMYQVKDGVTVPWFNEAGEKMVIRHHLNLRKQTSVKKAYIRKILAHGIMDGCRSQPWLVQPQPDSSGPYLAITFGTLSEAFYDSCEQFPTNRQVRATKAGGLRNCRIFMDRTPNDVLTFLKDVNNSFHLGSGITFHELVLGVVQVDEAWKAYMERNLLSARSCDRSQFLGWIGSSEFKEKYNGQTFKMAKALRTKLNRLQILNLWDNYFGEETDFLHTDLKSEKALTVMNDLGSMVESYFQGQPVHILGMLFFELCRMAVPLLPAADEDSSHRVPPFLFTKGPESTFFNEATLRLTCPIAGADFVGKLIAPDAAAKAAAKKRPKQPDLTEETEAKRAKKGVAKAKGKAKPQAKPKPESITAESKETVANLQTDIAFKELFGAGEVSSARPRRWMDDLVICLEKAYGKPLEQPDDTAAGGKTLVGNLLSMGLEFALTGKLTVDKKTYKDWSKVRPLLQTTLHRTMKKFNESSGALGGVGGQGLNDVANKLLTDISRASSSSGTLVGPQDSMEVVLRKVFDSKSDMTTAQTWVSRNKTDKVINHPAFTEFYNDLKVTIGCSCGQWDVDQCRFHEVCEHGIPDLIWGIKEVMEGEFVGRTGAVPVSLRMVGTAALASGRVVTAKLAEAAASADKEKPEKPLTMADFIGQYGSFLFTKNEINAADPALNTALLQLMISMKARYLLLAMETIVYYSSTSGQDKKKIVYLTDVPRPQALMSLLDWLCNSTSGLKYIVEVESRFQFLVQSSGADSPSQDWGTMWANILSQSLSKEAADSAKRDGGDDPSKVSADIDWKKHVPASSKVVKGKSLVVVSSETTGQGQEDAVKDEADKEQEPKEAAAASATAQPDQASIQSPYTSFADIYAMHEVPQAKSLNSMDVICIGQEIQSYLLKKAASSFAADKVKQLLNAMVVDPKNPGQCILQVPSIKIEDGEAPDARRLWVFGAVTTESGPRSIKVATALFDGDVKIDYYILGNGWEKATCAVPCPVWMCKSGFAEDKALFKGIAEEEQLEFADAHGAKRTVMLQRLGIELRAAAVHTILKKNTSDVICTRSALPGEEAQAKVGKKVAKSTLAIGGAALSTKRTGKGDGDQGKAKAEGGEGTQDDGDAWAWLFKSAPNKCAVHLLR